MSRTPVREALLRLEAMDLIRRLSKRGAVAQEAAVKSCEIHAAKLGDANPDGYYQLNIRFHEAVAVTAGNPFLTEIIETNARKLLTYCRARYRYAGAIHTSAQEHRQMLTLILARDSAGAESLMQRHIFIHPQPLCFRQTGQCRRRPDRMPAIGIAMPNRPAPGGIAFNHLLQQWATLPQHERPRA